MNQELLNIDLMLRQKPAIVIAAQKLILRLLESRLYNLGLLLNILQIDGLNQKLLNVDLMLMQRPAIITAVQKLNLRLKDYKNRFEQISI